jgi:hypothetical protein
MSWDPPLTVLLMVSYLSVDCYQIGDAVSNRSSRSEPLMLRGTLFTLRRRCGKANCRCATGPAHESPALAYPQAGRTKTITLAASEVEEVRAALERYHAAKAALDAEADQGLAGLRTRLSQRRRSR